MEDAVWKEVERVLTNPDVILQELKHRSKEKVVPSEVGRLVLEEQLGSLRHQALPLVGDLDPERLKSICAAVAEWLKQAGEPEKAIIVR